MKKLFIFTFLTCFTLLTAQNRSIEFEHGNLASVFERAKKENKLIFVDAYTSWCGPCKWMAKNIFTNDTAADYFNQNFVNYKLDMEKGEGVDFAAKYQVQCYPTLLILDASGKMVHRTSGGLPVARFIDFSKQSNTNGSFSSVKEAYEKDRMNGAKVVAYANAMSSTCLDASNEVNAYLTSVKEEDLIKEENWNLISEYTNAYDSREIKYFMKNYQAFESKYGKKPVEEKAYNAGRTYFTPFIKAKEHDKNKYEQAKAEFGKMNWPRSEQILFEADMEVFKRHDKQRYYECAARDFLKYNNDAAHQLNSMAWTFYENVSDKNLLAAAEKMAARACELNATYANLDTYAAVLFKSGKYKEADVQANRAIDKAKADKQDAKDYKETEDLLLKIRAMLK